MTHILEMFPPSKYIAAFELHGQDVTLTIERVVAEIIEGTDNRKDKRPVIYFSNGQKPFVANKTNVKIIVGKLGYGTDPKKWAGRSITLYPTTVKAFGETVEAIRVRPTVSQAAPPRETPPKTLSDRAGDAIEALKKATDVGAVDRLWSKMAPLAAQLKEAGEGDLLDKLTLTYEGCRSNPEAANGD
jgi:hypothetical protein